MPHVIVSSRTKGGHRRAGRFIPDGRTELDVTAVELKAIQADKNIVCLVQGAPETTPADQAPKKDGQEPQKPSGQTDQSKGKK